MSMLTERSCCKKPILDLTRRAADAIQLEYDAILRKIRRTLILYVDEKGIHVQGEKCWIWTFTT